MPFPGQTLSIQIKQSADPAAGVELSFTADRDMIVGPLTFQLVTSAVVANRRVELLADDGAGTVFFRATSFQDHAASTTVIYTTIPGIGASGPMPGRIVLAFPDGGIKLRKGDRLLTSTVLKDAGDNFSAMTLQAEYLP